MAAGVEQRITGLGQLSLVEHALCPLDARKSLIDNLVYSAKYSYPSSSGKRKEAQARVFSPLGLSAPDELYLWGLLALTMLQDDPEPELFATPHWILRQLGIISTNRRGGRQYQQFRDSLSRLSTVTYMNDAFYDPVREEHRQVSFSFFSYSLPQDPKSSRAWRIVWDPLFFEMVKAGAGQFRFDLAMYRELDAASRRLFLFVSKVLSRRSELKALRLEHVAVDLLGFSETLAVRDMKVRVKRCLRRLIELQVLSEAAVFKSSTKTNFVRLKRGPYFEKRKFTTYKLNAADSPLLDTLRAIGFEDAPAIRLIRRFPDRLLSEWCDITQAAIERYGKGYFSKSPMAFLVDSVDKSSKGLRTAPDWWAEQKREERRKQEWSEESQQVYAKIRSELFGDEALPAAAKAKGDEKKVLSLRSILSEK